MSASAPGHDPETARLAMELQRNALLAELVRRGCDDFAAVENFMLARERDAGVFAGTTAGLPPERRVVTELLTADLLLNRVVFVSAKDDLAAFRECFGLAGRHNDVTLYARGPLVCLSLQSTIRASDSGAVAAGAAAAPEAEEGS